MRLDRKPKYNTTCRKYCYACTRAIHRRKKGTDQVWCFDKQTDKVFSANIRGVLSGTRFYEVEVDGQTLSLEEPLSEIEGMLSPILARLVRDQKLAALCRPIRHALPA